MRSVAREAGEETTKVFCGKILERFGEHVMRISGAQFLSRRGVKLYIIQLVGRWGSLSVLRYVQEAPLAGAMQTRSTNSTSLAEIIELLKAETPQGNNSQVQNLSDEMQAIKDQLATLGKDTATTLEAQAIADTEIAAPSAGWVRNPSSKVMHSVLISPFRGRDRRLLGTLRMEIRHRSHEHVEESCSKGRVCKR